MIAAQVSTTQGQVDEGLYEKDFYAWTQEQAALLSQGRWTGLDISNLVEEIESLGKQQRSELRNRLKVLLIQLLKWQYQSGRRSRSWQNTINVQRMDIADLIAESPMLKALFVRSY